MPPRHDAEDSSSTLRVRQIEKLHPPGDECRLRIFKLARRLARVEASICNGVGTDHGRAANVAGSLPPTADDELHLGIDTALGTVFALQDDVRHDGTNYWLAELPEALQKRFQSLLIGVATVGRVGNKLDDPAEVARQQQELLADLQGEAGCLAVGLLAVAATLRARGNAELATLMEEAARNLAVVANSSKLEVSGVPATWASRPGPAPPPQVLSSHSIWTHGPPATRNASSRERVASGERRAFMST